MEKTANEHKTKTTNAMYYVGLGLVGIAIVLGIIFWLKGETKTYGEFPNPESASSLNCSAIGISYPFFEYDNSSKRTTEINATFSGDELDKISLEYILTYESSESIVESEGINHGAMNRKFSAEGLGTDAFEATYGRLNDGLKYSIWAKSNTIYKNDAAAKYFLLENIENKPYLKTAVKNAYKQKGFKCEE